MTARRERLYRTLLATYPRRFREQHGAALLDTLLDGAAGRGPLAEGRECCGLATGALRARGDDARAAGRGAWRHGAGALLAPLAAVNLAVIAAAMEAARHLRWGTGDAGVIGAWWVVAIVAAGGLAVAVAYRRRAWAVAFAVLGLVPLGYDEWLQATGRGDEDHLSNAAQRGFDGPQMSPFWLFLAVVVLVAALARPAGAGGRAREPWRLAALLGAAAAIAVTIPASLYALLAVALTGMVACIGLGALDRRLYGVGVSLWLIALPYVAWVWALDYPTHLTWILAYLSFPLLAVLAATVARRRRGQLVA